MNGAPHQACGWHHCSNEGMPGCGPGLIPLFYSLVGVSTVHFKPVTNGWSDERGSLLHSGGSAPGKARQLTSLGQHEGHTISIGAVTSILVGLEEILSGT